MQFEWDDAKAAQNLAKHGVPFEYAARVFLDPRRMDSEDRRREYGEERRITVGAVEGRLYVVAYTPRGETLRLISARKANEREQRQYDEALSD
jgi:uncharacterized protein